MFISVLIYLSLRFPISHAVLIPLTVPFCSTRLSSTISIEEMHSKSENDVMKLCVCLATGSNDGKNHQANNTTR